MNVTGTGQGSFSDLRNDVTACETELHGWRVATNSYVAFSSVDAAAYTAGVAALSAAVADPSPLTAALQEVTSLAYDEAQGLSDGTATALSSFLAQVRFLQRMHACVHPCVYCLAGRRSHEPPGLGQSPRRRTGAAVGVLRAPRGHGLPLLESSLAAAPLSQRAEQAPRIVGLAYPWL
jgi:hypothetical protein